MDSSIPKEAATTQAAVMQQTKSYPLCVDLDGTLVKTNTLFEAAFALVRARPLAVFQLLFWFLRGQAYLWEKIITRTRIDVRYLPYRREILDFIEGERRGGRSVFLVTGAHEVIARQVAEHLGCFAGSFGSTAQCRLVGSNKRNLLVKLFGGGEFDYIGDSVKDEPVFMEAREAVFVLGSRQPAKLESKARFLHVGSTSSIGPLLRALRPHQWAKNLLIFAPLVLAHRLNDPFAIVAAVITFLAFSLAASSAYCLNDLVDLDADRRHHLKRSRPVAAGDLSLQLALLEAVAVGAIGVLAAWWVSWLTLMVVGLYVLVTFAYSALLKRIIVFDVVVLSGLYALRLLAGSVATNIRLSPWTVTFSLFMFLSLALLKRFAELRNLGEKSAAAAAGRGYLVADLPQISALGAASGLISVLVIALYINGPDVQPLYREPERLWFICPLVAAWICRLWMLANRGEMNEDPVLFAMRDHCSWVVGALVFLVLLWAV